MLGCWRISGKQASYGKFKPKAAASNSAGKIRGEWV